MLKALIADIEAQVCRFAIMHATADERPVFSHHGEVKVAGCDGVLSAIKAYLSTLDIPCPENLGMAIAAPVKDGVFKVTQTGWASSEAELRDAFGFKYAVILNSAAASAISLAWLEPGDAVAVGSVTPPSTPLPAGRYAMITPEVGIGVSAVQISTDGRCGVIDTEGGHMSFAPQTPLEIELLQRLAPTYGRVSYERVITWPGLMNIYAAVCDQEGARPNEYAPMEVVLYGRTGADPLCVKALECFFGVLGDFVGDVALAVGADQGVFVSGAMLGEMQDAMAASSFRERFDNKGRLSGFVKKLPTWALVGHAREMSGIARHLIETIRDGGGMALPSPAPQEATPLELTTFESERMVSKVLDGVDVGVLVLDKKLNIITANDRYWHGSSAPSSARSSGSPAKRYVEAMVKGKDWSEETAATVLERLAMRQPFGVERTAFGGAVIRDEARPVPSGGWVITAVDITNSRRWTQELESITADLRTAKTAADAASGAKTTFLATMSHEIRTPLNGILGMAQAMTMDDLSEQQAERLDIIRLSGENLLAILNDILDLSKIEAGKLEIEEVAFDLDQLLMGAHSTFTAVANKKGLSFCLETDERASGVYLGDPTRLRQVLYNLVSNAIKFTETGEVRVSTSHCDGYLHMKVKDTGIGIPQDRVDSLFEKFMQVDASTTRNYGGTGLGLSICRDLADLMGGSIKVTSELGKGTCFEVVLPLMRSAEKPVGGFGVPVDMSAAEDAGELRVLAAEDNSVNQLVLKTLLNQIGVQVTVVGDGEQAVEAWEQEHWDVILMDVQMPKMDGPTAVKLIREREAATGRARTPIIALTANVMTHQVNEYLSVGMDACVGKPLQFASLVEAIVNATQVVEDQLEDDLNAA